jgi:rfaE bifunctional protein nucleotidyltransferase chain/domain
MARLATLARPLVFTNGVFDVLHRGHVVYLEQARALGASLLVALNTDASARRLGKGPDRPLNNEIDRACVIAALASSSIVTWFDEDTPIELIARVRPDILVKGGDYDMSKLAETAVSSIRVLISLAAAALRWARPRTSLATTANPRPCSPARAASTAAFSARMLV